MREILFRGKNKHGKWYYGYYTEGYYLDGTPVSWIEVVDRKKKDTDSPTVIPETVGQFTGLTDKNGKKIFEGDIVRNGEYTMIVVWYDFLASFASAFSVDGNYHETMSKSDVYLEVIGNIHDNPELLEATP